MKQKFDGWPTKTNVPEPNAEALKYGMSKLHLSAAREARKCIIRKNMDSDTRGTGGSTPINSLTTLISKLISLHANLTDIFTKQKSLLKTPTESGNSGALDSHFYPL